MSQSLEMCSTCLEIGLEKLVSAEEVGLDGVKWCSKLSLCVPELEWKTDCLLCQSCTHKLQVVYEFRNLCLHSYELQTQKCKGDDATKDENSEGGNSLDATCEYGDDTSDTTKKKSKDPFCTSLEEISTLIKVKDGGDDLPASTLRKKFKANKLRDVKNNQCKMCKLVLDSRRTLLLHATDCHVDERIRSTDYICYHCNQNFTDKLILTDHIHDVHGKVKLEEAKECQICKNVFEDQATLENHLILEHRIGETTSTRKAKKHKCSKCSKMYTTEKIMKIHGRNCNGGVVRRRNSKSRKEMEEEKSESRDELFDSSEREPPDDAILECAVDERIFCKDSSDEANDTNLEGPPKLKRGRKAKEKQINKCEICGIVFSTRYLLNRHVRNVHATEKVHDCDICGQKFASPVYLSAHKRYHSRERPHICSFCGKGYITASDLYHHEKIHANKRAYKCAKCPKAFNTSSDLHKHKICVHVDRSEWKYVCSFCERRFPLKTNLDTHTKTHTGERNFACHLCDRRCINRSVLLRHIESHSNVRSFRCGVCNQDYKYQKSLAIHMTKAHGIGDAKIPERVKKYFCHICPKSYFANNKLQKHIRTHTGERPFACEMCDKRFIDKSYVKQHLKTAHNVNFSSVP